MDRCAQRYGPAAARTPSSADGFNRVETHSSEPQWRIVTDFLGLTHRFDAESWPTTVRVTLGCLNRQALAL